MEATSAVTGKNDGDVLSYLRRPVSLVVVGWDPAELMAGVFLQ